MALHKIFLQSRKVILRNVLVAERAETCGHAIDGLGIIVGLTVEVFAAMLDSGAAFVGKRQLGSVAQYSFDKVIGER